jgi:hypothetical protein
MTWTVSISESWGPMLCEVGDCGAEAWSIVLNDRDYLDVLNETGRKASEGVGNEGISYIFSQQLGIAACDDHQRQAAEQAENEGTVPL